MNHFNDIDFQPDDLQLNPNLLEYLKILSNQYPTIRSASTEIINLQAILNLPKGTEHFITDIHGEYEAFNHVIKNGSGVIRRKIDDLFESELSEAERRTLATLIYYPEQKLDLIQSTRNDLENWYKNTLHQLILLCRLLASKYTRSKVSKTIPEELSYIIEELLHENEHQQNKEQYYQEIIDTIISLDRADDFIIAISKIIQRLAVDQLHIIGDIYDRGPGAEIVMDTLMDFHSVDIQWGNHDVLWMGAAAGSQACIANVLRVTLRYGNLETLEEGYGISLLPLATFAMDVYQDDPCHKFIPKIPKSKNYTESDINLISKMHKAITIIQFKLEAEVIKRRDFQMEDRLLLDKINFKKGTVHINDQDYLLNDQSFPTINPDHPYRLTEEEKAVIDKLTATFLYSDKLQRHTNFLFSNGGMYLCYNSNLLFHGCIPMDKDGSFSEIVVNGSKHSGKALIDQIDKLCREGYYHKKDQQAKEYGMDLMWYLWCGADSPLYGKMKMASFERYFIDNKETHGEQKNPYYHFRDNYQTVVSILEEFGLHAERSHIINGHVPVKVKKGESPVKANGKLLVIDGGFSKAYQSQTGIAGYTLIFNSNGLLLVSHEPFESAEKAIIKETDIIPDKFVLEYTKIKKQVRETDIGKEVNQQIKWLRLLLQSYQLGYIKERKRVIKTSGARHL
ncbi:MAG: fructose-1,6-bisphosphatase [Spirochaetes bacterium]|nr:fructose-1,6-bisphosphatase [Spirochaetota bacterium]